MPALNTFLGNTVDDFIYMWTVWTFVLFFFFLFFLLSLFLSSFQFWPRTASPSTPPSWTPMCTWSARTRPASLTSAWLSLLTARVGRGPASQRKLESGIAETASGRTSTSTAQAHQPRHSSEVRSAALAQLVPLSMFILFFLLQLRTRGWQVEKLVVSKLVLGTLGSLQLVLSSAHTV